MNESRHTPGPWLNSPSNHVYSKTGRLVADAGDSDFGVDSMEANARLIGAAPDLLAALEKISSNAAENPEWIRRVADQAIAKAEDK